MQKLPLPDVTTILMGQSPPGSTYNELGEGLPFFQGKAEFGERFPTPKKWCSAPQRVAEAGDILVSVRAPVGPTNVAAVRCCIGRGLAAIRADGLKLEADYLRFFLRYSEPRLASMGQGSTFAAIGRADITSLRIPLPPLNEQRRIADLLSRAEGIVRLCREAQKKTAEIIPALFLDIFGDPATNPKGWTESFLGEHVAISSVVRTPDIDNDADHLCMGADSIESKTGKMLYCPTVQEVAPRSGKYWFEPGDVLYSKIRPYLAKVALAARSGYCSADMYPLRCKETIVPRFLLSLLLSKAFTNFATAESVRAQMPKLNRETLFSYRFPLPPLSLQERFMMLAGQSDSILDQQSLALQRAATTFNALLARTFGGCNG